MKILLLIIFISIFTLFSQSNLDKVEKQISYDFNKLLSTLKFDDKELNSEINVELKVYVSELGVVQNVEIVSASNNNIANKISEQVRKFKEFTPAFNNGDFVDSWIIIPFIVKSSNGNNIEFYNANPNENDIELDKMPVIDMNKLMSKVKYPESAYSQKIQGKVIADILINEIGEAEEIKISSSDNSIFNDAVIDAIKKYGKFIPAEKDSVKVKSWVSVPFSFVYQEKEKSDGKVNFKSGMSAMVDLNKIKKFVKYPTEAQKNNIEGQVILKCLVNEKGKFVSVFVEKSDNAILNEAAVNAIKSYGKAEEPANEDGKPVACWIHIPINFKLK